MYMTGKSTSSSLCLLPLPLPKDYKVSYAKPCIIFLCRLPPSEIIPLRPPVSDWPISTYLRGEVFRLCAHTIFIKLFGLDSITTTKFKATFCTTTASLQRRGTCHLAFGNIESFFFCETVKFMCFIINKTTVQW